MNYSSKCAHFPQLTIKGALGISADVEVDDVNTQCW